MFESVLAERGLSLDRLKNFCAIAEAGGIARTAGGDPAKQSLYSRQVRELEHFFGTELTRRKGKGIELTEQGLELARQARAHLISLADFKKSCAGQPVQFRIASGNGVIEWLLIQTLGRYRFVKLSVSFSPRYAHREPFADFAITLWISEFCESPLSSRRFASIRPATSAIRSSRLPPG